MMTKSSTGFARKVTPQRSCFFGEISSAQLSQLRAIRPCMGRPDVGPMRHVARSGELKLPRESLVVTRAQVEEHALVTFLCKSIENRDVWESKRFALWTLNSLSLSLHCYRGFGNSKSCNTGSSARTGSRRVSALGCACLGCICSHSLMCSLSGRRVFVALYFIRKGSQCSNALPPSSVMNSKKWVLPSGAWLRSDRRSAAGTDTQHQTLL